MTRDSWLDLDHGRITLVETGTSDSARYLLGLTVMADAGDAEARCDLSRRELCQVAGWLDHLLAEDASLSLPEVLRSVRLARRLSQERLAECLGLDRSTVVRWEIGERSPSRDVVRRLVATLRLSHDEWHRLARAYLGDPVRNGGEGNDGT
jgi:DNA-binding XRE family transcriptional regulator